MSKPRVSSLVRSSVVFGVCIYSNGLSPDMSILLFFGTYWGYTCFPPRSSTLSLDRDNPFGFSGHNTSVLLSCTNDVTYDSSPVFLLPYLQVSQVVVPPVIPGIVLKTRVRFTSLFSLHFFYWETSSNRDFPLPSFRTSRPVRQARDNKNTPNVRLSFTFLLQP